MFIAAGMVVLAGAAFLDAWRMGGRESPAILAGHVRTPFEQLGQDLGNLETVQATVQDNDPQALRQAARRQLLVEPLTALAIPLAAPGKPFESTAALKLAERVSRREPQVQLQLASLAAREGDLAESLAHLDKALQVTPALSDKILPPLVPALGVAGFRKAIGKYSERPWFWQFARTAAAQPAAARDTANLFAELKDKLKRTPDTMLPVVLGSLLADSRTLEARHIALASGKISAAALDEFSPTPENTNPALGPLTWRLANSEAAIVALDKDNGWSATIEPGQSVTLFERVTILIPGLYRVEIPYENGESEVKLNIRIECQSLPVDSKKQLFSGEIHRRRSLQILVAPHCRLQTWMIQISAADTQSALEIQDGGPMRLRRE